MLVFGAGTDYSLLLVHRYREELQRGRPPPEALPLALRETIPAVAASGGTVIAAMLVLLVADLQSTHWLGPILAIGIAVMVCSAFTLLPALLAVLGERAFWPGRRGAPAPQGPSRLGADRGAGPSAARGRSSPLVTAGLLVLALGNLIHHGTIGFGQGETKPTNSSEGTAVLNEHFPPGLGSPLTAVVPADEAAKVTAGMRNLASVRLALPVPAGSGFDSAAVVARPRRQPLLGRSGGGGRKDPRTACTRSRRRRCSAASRRRTGTSSRPTPATPG